MKASNVWSWLPMCSRSRKSSLSFISPTEPVAWVLCSSTVISRKLDAKYLENFCKIYSIPPVQQMLCFEIFIETKFRTKAFCWDITYCSHYWWLSGSRRRVRIPFVLLDPKMKVMLYFETSTIRPSTQHQIQNSRILRHKFWIYFLGKLHEEPAVGFTYQLIMFSPTQKE